jgi:hypothetical protein
LAVRVIFDGSALPRGVSASRNGSSRKPTLEFIGSGPQPASRAAATAVLFDDIISDGKQRRRDSEAERLSGLEVNHALEFGRLLYGKVAGFFAAYEIHLRLCDFAGEPSLWRRGWHHGTNAQFSSAATAARLAGDDPLCTAHAMAIRPAATRTPSRNCKVARFQ